MIDFDIFEVNGRDVWPLFAPHHYLTAKYAGHRAFLLLASDGEPVAFTSSRVMPHWAFKNGRREHRTVVLPDFQGLGIGARLSDWLAEWHLAQDHRFYSRTSHPRLGAYRDASPRWRTVAGSGKRQKVADDAGRWVGGRDAARIAFSHEYIGGAP